LPSEDVLAELARILVSEEFKATPRRRKMLQYLVEEMLAGRSSAIKGYSIGLAVFGRDEDFDPQADPVVRLEARRLRRDLDGYYVSAGRDNPLRISIPKGHYIPEVEAFSPDVEPPGSTIETTKAPAGALSAAVTPSHRARRAAAKWGGKGLGWMAAAVLLGVVSLIALDRISIRDRQLEANEAAMARGPALMVLPFEVRGNRPEASVLAIGIADETTIDLNRFPDLRIFLPPAGQGAAGSDPVETGKQLGIGYLLEGSVAVEGADVKIGARLVDVFSGQIIWSEQFDRTLAAEEVMAVQSEIAAAIASVLGQPYGIIRTEQMRRLPSGIAPSLPSYECVLRAYAYRRTFDPALHGPLQACLETAVQRDPDYPEAWAMLGWMYLDAGRYDLVPAERRQEAYDRALDAASRAAQIDGSNILALKVLASIDHYLGNYAESERLQRRALALNPNDPDTLAQLGWRLAVRGNFKEGIPYLHQAIERTINPPGWYYHLIAVNDYLNGRYADMLSAARHGTATGLRMSWAFAAIAQGALGNRSAAQEALAKMAALSPQLARDPAALFRRHQATDEIVDALMEGLRKAGWRPPAAESEESPPS